MRQSSEVLNEFPEWHNDWQSHALFCAYDQDSSEEFIISFWKRAIQKLFDESVPGLSVDTEHLKQMTHRNGRYPTGLYDILSELVSRRDLTCAEQLESDLADEESSQYWGYWLKKSILGVKPVKFKITQVASPAKLKLFCEKMKKICKDKERNIFTAAEISNMLGLNETDTSLFLKYMKLQKEALSFFEDRGGQIELVKIRETDEALAIKPEDSAVVQLNLTLSDIEKKISQFSQSAEEIHKSILLELRKQNKLAAKHLLVRKKMILTKIEELQGARLNIEQQLLSIKNSLTNKEILSALKTSNEVLKKITPDLKEVEKVIDDTKENLEINNEISQSFSVQNDEQDLIDEFEALGLDLPSVPVKPVLKLEESKTVRISNEEASLEDEFEKLEVRNLVIN